jgi:GNAT superfamily N-acetyltransferase
MQGYSFFMKIKRMSGDEIWPFIKKHDPKIYRGSQFYPAYEHMNAHEKKGFQKRKVFLKERIEIFFGLFDEKDRFAGWTAAVQMRPNELYMINSAVLPKYRRKGWYTKLVLAMLKEAKAEGFQMIVSNHIATNNSVIIAKMKLGFMISGLEMLDEVGLLVKLTYYLNPMRTEMLKYRTGEIHPTARVKKILKLK